MALLTVVRGSLRRIECMVFVCLYRAYVWTSSWTRVVRMVLGVKGTQRSSYQGWRKVGMHLISNFDGTPRLLISQVKMSKLSSEYQ